MLANKLLNEDGSHDFTPEQPNMTWVTDCSELRFGPDRKYQATTVSWSVSGAS